jgi:hypothetical protein
VAQFTKYTKVLLVKGEYWGRITSKKSLKTTEPAIEAGSVVLSNYY